MNAKFKGLLLAAIAAMGFVVYAADLPDGCRRVWYLQGDGQAYIELDFPLTHEQTVMCEFSCLNLNEAQGIFGARESPSANNCGVFVNDQMIQMQYGDYNQNFDYGKFQSRTRYRLTVGANLREALNLETGVAPIQQIHAQRSDFYNANQLCDLSLLRLVIRRQADVHRTDFLVHRH